MKTIIAVIALALLALCPSTGRAQTFTSAICPPTSPPNGVVTIAAPVIPTVSKWACGWGFTVNTSPILIQVVPPIGRNHVLITNNALAGGTTLGICLGFLEAGTVCTLATAAVQLQPGQAYEAWSVMVNNGSGAQQLNTLFMNSSIEIIGSGGGGTASVTIE